MKLNKLEGPKKNNNENDWDEEDDIDEEIDYDEDDDWEELDDDIEDYDIEFDE